MGTSLVLLPTYNERENLSRIVPRLFSALEEDLDVLVIDDASPDGTGELAEELRARYRSLSVLHRVAKEGLGPAYLHGFRVALEHGYSRVVTMDADLSHAPEDVPRLLDALKDSDVDVAIGSRHASGGGIAAWPLWRRFLSRVGSFYARTLLRLPVQDVTSGFRAYRAEVLERIDLDLLDARGFVFQVEILRRILDLPGTRAIEVPILFRNRTQGHSKMSFPIISEAVVDVASLAFRKREETSRGLRHPGRQRSAPVTVSVIVPARPDAAEPEALHGITGLDHPVEKLEVFVARGCSPSRQRNLAVKESCGDHLLFLDDDSVPDPGLLRIYQSVLEKDPTVGAVGGPSESLVGNRFQSLAALVLGEPWVMGKSASRYRALWKSRRCDERELILCNLCVRRSAFEDVGGLREDLYPNEENEFLERLRIRGWKLIHRPDALVRRPQRKTLGELLATVHCYGKGRGQQIRSLASRVSLVRLGLMILAGLGLLSAVAGLFLGSVVFSLPLLFYGLYLLLLSARLWARAGFEDGVLGSLLSGLLQGSYALGVARGLWNRNCVREMDEVQIERIESYGTAWKEHRS